MPSLMRYAESGYIYLTDYEYNLSVDERKAHIGTFIQGMEHNPRITLGIFLQRQRTQTTWLTISPSIPTINGF